MSRGIHASLCAELIDEVAEIVQRGAQFDPPVNEENPW